MIKLTGSVSRKIPIPGMDFSSQSFGAGMEVEVGNNASTEEIQKKFKEMYNLLETSVKEQITVNGKVAPKKKESAKVQKKEPKKTPEREVPQDSKEPAPKKATSPQITMIERLANQLGLSQSDKAKALAVKTVKEASQQIKKMLETPRKGGRIFVKEGVAK